MIKDLPRAGEGDNSEDRWWTTRLIGWQRAIRAHVRHETQAGADWPRGSIPRPLLLAGSRSVSRIANSATYNSRLRFFGKRNLVEFFIAFRNCLVKMKARVPAEKLVWGIFDVWLSWRRALKIFTISMLWLISILIKYCKLSYRFFQLHWMKCKNVIFQEYFILLFNCRLIFMISNCSTKIK